MNYKKMWYMMKEKLLKEAQTKIPGKESAFAAEQHLKAMADIEIKAMKEELSEYGCCGCSDGGERQPEENESHIGPRSCPDETQEKEKTSKDILKDIFGKDFVDNLEDLKAKLNEDGVKVIMVDADLKIPEELEKEAKEKKIAIGRAQCGAFKMGSDGPFPMPFPFPLGFLK